MQYSIKNTSIGVHTTKTVLTVAEDVVNEKVGIHGKNILKNYIFSFQDNLNQILQILKKKNRFTKFELFQPTKARDQKAH